MFSRKNLEFTRDDLEFLRENGIGRGPDLPPRPDVVIIPAAMAREIVREFGEINIRNYIAYLSSPNRSKGQDGKKD